jgi:dipeptidyl aminopeptidase/acylaminoacyl peptidase
MALDGTMVSDFPVPERTRGLVPSPDGRTIAYLQELDDAGVHLWLMDRDGGNRRPVVEGDRVVESVSWSPDGGKLVFDGSTVTETNDIWVVNANGSGLIKLTPDPAPAVFVDRSPSWSPDGARIAFISNRSGSSRLWVMNANGANPVQLVTVAEARESAPAWSPDGSQIAFLSSSPGVTAIGVVRADGTQYRTFPVTGDAGRIAWTPNAQVLYSTNSTGNYEIYSLDPATGASTNLTRHATHDYRAVPFRWVEPTAWRGLAAGTRYATNRVDPPGLGVGDVDGDGAQDVFVLAPGSSEIRYFRGTGDGTLQAVGALTAPDDQREIAVVDFNRDGYDDIIVLGANALSVWKGSAGGPGIASQHPFAGDGRGLATFDFDRTGAPDVAPIHQEAAGGFGMLVHGAEPDGDLIAILDYHATFTGGGRACAGDVSGDTFGDVVVATTESAAPLVIVPGQGDITFGAALVGSNAVGADPDAIPVCADFTGDRRVDVAYLRPDRANGLSILRSTGTALGTPTPIAVRGIAAVAADFDRDGDVDVLVASAVERTITMVRNRGDGSFATPLSIAAGGTPVEMVVADMNDDGWLDLVTVDSDGSLAVRLNRGR